tara:strand:+ start:207 stop:653 length:447 start_codon:yes stop_codon:yes gene_type:complete
VEVERELLQELQLEEHLEQIQLLYVKHLQAVAVAVQGELGFNLEQLVDLVVEAHVVVLVDLEQLVKEMMVVMELLDQQEHLIMEQAAVVELAQSDQMEHRLKVAMVVLDQVHLHYQVVPLQVEVVDQLIALVETQVVEALVVVEQELM